MTASTTSRPPAAASTGSGADAQNVRSVVTIGVALAAVVVSAITALTGGALAAELGLPDPGLLIEYGLPIARTVAQICAVLTVGSLFLAAVLVPPQASGYLDAAGYRALRAAVLSAGGWAAAAVLMVPLSVAEALGRPVDDFAAGRLVVLVPQVSTASAWLATAALAACVMAGAHVVLSWGGTLLLASLAVVGLLPVVSQGHSGAGGNHDIATDSLLLHVVGASLWVGGLVAVLALAARSQTAAQLPQALARFSAAAGILWAVMAVSGVVNLVVRVPVTGLLGSTYGALVAVKTGALLVLGLLGYVHRRRSLPQVRAGARGALLRFGAVEVLIMMATIGTAVGLGRTEPPASELIPETRISDMIGFELGGAPSLLGLLTDWRLDLVFGALVVIAAGGYLGAVRRVRAAGGSWSIIATAFWMSGCTTVLLATSSGIGRYAPVMFSVAMAAHVLLSIVAPLLLVLGAPARLAMRALAVGGDASHTGAREQLEWITTRAANGGLARPGAVVALLVGASVGVLATGFLEVAMRSTLVQVGMNLITVAVGLAFWTVALRIARTPESSRARRWWLIAGAVAQVAIGVALLVPVWTVDPDLYTYFALPWVPDLVADQRLGGLIWLVGQVPLVLVAAAAALAGTSRRTLRPPTSGLRSGISSGA